MGQDRPRSANPIPDLLSALADGLRGITDGVVASYIPQLARADPGWFGMVLCTLDGHVYACGDADQRFTLQSVSKPFVYALALAGRGLDDVIGRVGWNPVGRRSTRSAWNRTLGGRPTRWSMPGRFSPRRWLAAQPRTNASAVSVPGCPPSPGMSWAWTTPYTPPKVPPAIMMIMGPGGYRFGDYWKLGLPLMLWFLTIGVLLVPVIWPF